VPRSPPAHRDPPRDPRLAPRDGGARHRSRARPPPQAGGARPGAPRSASATRRRALRLRAPSASASASSRGAPSARARESSARWRALTIRPPAEPSARPSRRGISSSPSVTERPSGTPRARRTTRRTRCRRRSCPAGGTHHEHGSGRTPPRTLGRAERPLADHHEARPVLARAQGGAYGAPSPPRPRGTRELEAPHGGRIADGPAPLTRLQDHHGISPVDTSSAHR
jgi:hypothetical protein